MKQDFRPVDDGIALLSLHDVSPAFEDDVVASYDLLMDLGITSFTLLVTPMYGLKKMNSFEKNPLFSEFLKSLGLEMSLHGYSHFTKSGSMDEFHKMERDRVLGRIKSGMRMISDSLGQIPSGFVPPLWKAPQRVAGSVQDAGLEYCVIENRIHSFLDSSIETTAGFLISQGTKDVTFTNMMLEVELGGPIQIAVHPRDHRTNRLFELLADLRDRLEYRFIGYRDLITSKKRQD